MRLGKKHDDTPIYSEAEITVAIQSTSSKLFEEYDKEIEAFAALLQSRGFKVGQIQRESRILSTGEKSSSHLLKLYV